MSEEEKLPRKTYKLALHKFKVIEALMPPNTLTNADGTPYSAGYDRAIDEQKARAHQYAKAFTVKLYDEMCLSVDEWIEESTWTPRRQEGFKRFLAEHFEEFALTILKDTSSQ